MLKSILCLLLVLNNVSGALSTPYTRTVFEMKTGIQLRMHVVAHDDTEAMQRLKIIVRDAVRAAYRENLPDPQDTMLANAQVLLPLLAETAVQTARQEGFEGGVQITIETRIFPSYDLGSMTLPAGEYPAFMIRLGDAQGHNWWGLIDPTLALWSASTPQQGKSNTAIVWDWSLRSFFAALLGRPLEKAAVSDV